MGVSGCVAASNSSFLDDAKTFCLTVALKLDRAAHRLRPAEVVLTVNCMERPDPVFLKLGNGAGVGLQHLELSTPA